MNFLISFLASFILVIIPTSFFEWWLHKCIMHRPFLKKFTYAFKAHTVVHHGQFKADGSYHFNQDSNQDITKIKMAWWNGPLLIFLLGLPFLLIALFWSTWGIWTGIIAAVGAYYATYEYLHWCMHLPKNRWFEHTRVFKWLNGHHLLHHHHMGKNFNVVFPFADWFLKTLITRADCPFNQPVHPAVPDLQPLREPPHH